MNNWTVADFLTYTYQLVADADFQTDTAEVDIIKTQVAKVLAKYFGIQDYSYANSLKKIQETEGVSILNCRETVQELMSQFEFSKEAKLEIFGDFHAIASSDSLISHSERETIRYIKQLFYTVEMPLSW
jgi:uncharacterized tellurite resistance protein B-like protein